MNIEKSEYPRRIVLEPTNKCNIECGMCARTWRNFRYSTLSLEIVEKMKLLYKHANEVTLFGWGEPLLHPNIKEMFQTVTQENPQIKTYLSTNGTMLTQDLIQTFVDGKMTYLTISLDGASPETYNRIRIGSDFDKVLSNVAELIKYKKQSQAEYPYVRFTMVLMKDNIGELPDLVKLAVKMGVNEVRGVYLVVYNQKMKDQSLFFHQDLIKEQFAQAKKVAEDLGINLNLPPVIGQTNTQDSIFTLKDPGNCEFPYTTMWVQANGQVRPCSISPSVLGNLNIQDPVTIWNSDPYDQFRKKNVSNQPPEECVVCSQSRFSDINNIDAHLAINEKFPESQ